MKVPVSSPDVEQVDKSIAVIWGLGDRSVEQAEALLQELLENVAGFRELHMTESQPALLAHFQSSALAMRFIRTQKRHRGLQSASRSKRYCMKVVSNLKKCLVEIGGHAATDLIASYPFCRIVVRENSKQIPLALIKPDLGIEWLHDEIATQPIRKALQEFIVDM